MNLNMNANLNDATNQLRRLELKKSTEGIPLYPSETENAVLVNRWAEAFEDFAATKISRHTPKYNLK